MDWQQVWQTVQDWLTNTGIKLLIAIAIMIVSFALINWLSKKIAKRADKKVEENKKMGTSGILRPDITAIAGSPKVMGTAGGFCFPG